VDQACEWIGESPGGEQIAGCAQGRTFSKNIGLQKHHLKFVYFIWHVKISNFIQCQAGRKTPCISLFTGVAGLELGLAQSSWLQFQVSNLFSSKFAAVVKDFVQAAMFRSQLEVLWWFGSQQKFQIHGSTGQCGPNMSLSSWQTISTVGVNQVRPGPAILDVGAFNSLTQFLTCIMCLELRRVPHGAAVWCKWHNETCEPQTFSSHPMFALKFFK
jgi:hypothetical protein